MSARRTKSGAAASDQQKKIIAISVFVVLAAGVLYFELADTSAKRPVSISSSSRAAPGDASSDPIVSTRTAAGAGGPRHPAGPLASTSAALDPTLHMQGMLAAEAVSYSGTGRNIFGGSFSLPVVKIAKLPQPIADPRTRSFTPLPSPAQTGPSFPAIDLKLFGISTSLDGRRQAFLVHGDDVFLAASGAIVQRKYRVIDIGLRSVQIEDLTNNNRQTLQLLVTP